MGVILVVGAALLAVLIATGRIVRTNALARAGDDLQATRTAFYHLVDHRADFAATQLRLIAELPVFRAHLTDARLATDAATIHAMADEYRRSLNAQFSIVTRPDGSWIASPGWTPDVAPPSELRVGIAAAGSNRSHRAIVPVDGRLYLVVSEPATFADEVLATLTAGYHLDDTVARELALTTRCDVNLIVGGRLSGSSLAAPQRAALEQLLESDPNAAGRLEAPAEPRAVGTLRYVGGTYALHPDGAAPSAGALMLLQDWEPTQKFVDEIHTRVLWLGALTFGLALGSGLLVSRSMTRPLREIAAVTGEIAAGHWDRTVPVHGSGEAAAMALAFNDMTASLSHWHAEAGARARQVQDSYERFFAVTQSASDAIVSTDAAGAIIFWNRSAASIFGYAEEEIMGRPFVDMLDPASHRAYAATLTQVRRATQASSDGTMEARGVRKDGASFPMELSLSTWVAGETLNFTAIVRDISERKRAEAALHDREIELRQAQKMEAIGRLAGGVAHDFNNLLTAIQGYGEMVLESLGTGDAEAARRADVMQILKAAESAGSLTRQLLAFSRKQVLAPRVVSLDDIVAGTQNMLRRLIGEDIELVVRPSAERWCVKADPGQLEQVVMNLALNARDAMDGGGRIVMAIENVRSAGAEAVVLSVTDTGCGMDDATLSRIFEPFFTTKPEGQGTGLGLAMVHGIVKQSGGSISVQSASGRGTTFRVSIPRAHEETPARETTAAQAVDRARGETVLLVEDEPSVRTVAREVLRREGYEVLVAARGDEALEVAARHPRLIHLLVSDVVMPGLNGPDLWARLSAARPDTKVLFMSGYIDNAVVRHRIHDAGLPFLQKPFSLVSLADAVRRALAGQLSQ